MFVSFVLILLSTTAYCKAEVCQSRDYGNGGTVCVCNSDYCDTVPRPEKIEQPQFHIYTSNKAGLRFEKTTGLFQETGGEISDNQIIIDTKEKYQKILGWGGAFTDSAGINIKSLDDKTQEHLLRSYFSDEGIEYSLCRVPIGGTDFSLHGYSYDDGDTDETLTNFKLASEDFEYKIPYIQKALDLTSGNLKLFASVWTAPKWMKTNGEYYGYGFLLENMYQAWADYFVKFLDNYQQQNISFWGITTGNEPSLASVPFKNINTVGWTSEQLSTWILNNLGPTLRSSPYKDIKIITLDDQRFFLPWFVADIFKDNITRDYVDGIAVHWYYDFIISANLLKDTHEAFPEKFILGTEACNGYLPILSHVNLGSWDSGERYANDIIQDISNWVGGWVDWNMALDLTGGPTYIENYVDSPIIVNATAGEFYKQPMFYNIGHFSKFVPRNSIRVGASGFDQNIPVVAFRTPDNATVLVILNKKNEVVPVTIIDDLRGSSQIELIEKSISTILYW